MKPTHIIMSPLGDARMVPERSVAVTLEQLREAHPGWCFAVAKIERWDHERRCADSDDDMSNPDRARAHERARVVGELKARLDAALHAVERDLP